MTARGTTAGPGGIAIADVPDRVIAWIIDGIIFLVIGGVISLLFGALLTEQQQVILFGVPTGVTVNQPSFLGQLIAVLLVVGISAGYFIFLWMQPKSATVGQMVMKLSVRDAATGGHITQSQAINRWLVLGLPLALYNAVHLIFILGFFVALAVLGYMIYLLVTTSQSPTRQGFHDKFAKTVVAKVAM